MPLGWDGGIVVWVDFQKTVSNPNSMEVWSGLHTKFFFLSYEFHVMSISAQKSNVWNPYHLRDIEVWGQFPKKKKTFYWELHFMSRYIPTSCGMVGDGVSRAREFFFYELCEICRSVQKNCVESPISLGRVGVRSISTFFFCLGCTKSHFSNSQFMGWV